MSHNNEVPGDVITKWQHTVDVMAQIFKVPAGLIMRVHPEHIEVFIANHSEECPYHKSDQEKLNSGLYCETVMKSGTLLEVPNALLDAHWKNNPDIKLNMISYLGVPIYWSDKEVFGTICVLDKKTRRYKAQFIDLLWEFKKTVESDLQLIEYQDKLIEVRTQEITQQKELAVIAQLESENRYRRLFEMSRDAQVIIAPPSWLFQETNIAALNLFGLPTGADFSRLQYGLLDFSPECQPDGQTSHLALHAYINFALTEGCCHFEWQCTHVNGKAFDAMVQFTKMEAGGQAFLQGSIRDITSIKVQQRLLENLAHFDSLTSLPNRALLLDRLQQAIALAKRDNKMIGVAFVDLDGFKTVNDTYGHAIGDQLLVKVAAAMKQVLRQTDTLARIGGDEFVIVMVGLNDQTSSEILLKRLLEAISKVVSLGEIQVHITGSAGISYYPQRDEVAPDQLLRQADQALYAAKLSGKNQYLKFDAARDHTERNRTEILKSVRQGIKRNEFILYYQPKVELCTGKVLGVEALIRWRHPTQGLLLPGRFLSEISGHPIELEIGEWVIDQALNQIEQWQTVGLDLQISINIGASHLQQVNFFDRLQHFLRNHPKAKGGQMEIEILETSTLKDLPNVINLIHRCSEMGVEFALDDFGTGYSSLNYLKQLPVRTLKIDQGFIRSMLENSEDMAIVKGILELAAIFQRKVIAEGVETLSHYHTLQNLKCGQAQGYGIARPMLPEDIPEWIVRWEKEVSNLINELPPY